MNLNTKKILYIINVDYRAYSSLNDHVAMLASLRRFADGADRDRFHGVLSIDILTSLSDPRPFQKVGIITEGFLQQSRD